MSVIRDLLVQFGVAFDTSGITKGESAIDGLIGKLRGVGAALAGAFALDKVRDFAFAVINQADAIDNQAQRLSVSTRALQEWQYAAQFADIAAAELDGIFNRLAVSATAAGDATSEQGKLFDRLGVQVKNAAGQFKSADVLFAEAGTALAALPDATERTALAMQIFGKSGATRVLQLFKDGAPGIEKLRREFHELGGGFDPDFIQRSAEVNDQLDRLSLAWLSVKVRITGFFVPAIQSALTWLTRAAVWLRELEQRTHILRTGLVVLGAIGIVKLSAMLGPLGALTRAFGLLAIKVALPLLLLEDLLTFLDGGDSLTGRALDKIFGEGTQQKVRDFISDVRKEFGKFIDDLLTKPGKVRDEFLLFFDLLSADARQHFGPVWGGILDAWLDVWRVTLEILFSDWTRASDLLSAVWDGIKLAFEIAWTEIKFFGLGVVAELSDAINGLLKQFDELTGTDFSIGGTSAAEDIDRQRTKERRRLADEGTEIGKRLERRRTEEVSAELVARRADARPGAYLRDLNQQINIPPGTPADQVRAVRAAAREGARRGIYEGTDIGTTLPGARPARSPNRAAAESFKRKGK